MNFWFESMDDVYRQFPHDEEGNIYIDELDTEAEYLGKPDPEFLSILKELSGGAAA